MRSVYPGPPPRDDRRVTWRSVTAGVLLNAAMFLVLVAVSHPVAVTGLIVAGAVSYALVRIVRRVGVERTILFCRGGVCLRLQLHVG